MSLGAGTDAAWIQAELGRLGAHGVGAGDRFPIAKEFCGCYVGTTPGGDATLLIPLGQATSSPGKVTAGLELRPWSSFTYDYAGQQWNAPTAVLTCSEPELLDTFCVLAADVARRLSEVPGTSTWEEVLAAVGSWERLLRSTRTLSPAEELGLWGELSFIAEAVDPDGSIAAWQGPSGAAVDFVANGIGVECKTSSRRAHHHVSANQAERPLGDIEAYLVSSWIGIDPVGGTTLPELVGSIRERSGDPAVFERKLMEARYSDEHAAKYTRRLVALEPPLWFELQSIPGVHGIDRGVTNVRYEVDLDVDDALAPAEAETLAHRLRDQPTRTELSGPLPRPDTPMRETEVEVTER